MCLWHFSNLIYFTVLFLFHASPLKFKGCTQSKWVFGPLILLNSYFYRILVDEGENNCNIKLFWGIHGCLNFHLPSGCEAPCRFFFTPGHVDVRDDTNPALLNSHIKKRDCKNRRRALPPSEDERSGSRTRTLEPLQAARRRRRRKAQQEFISSPRGKNARSIKAWRSQKVSCSPAVCLRCAVKLWSC